jgi:hypothetical protein
VETEQRLTQAHFGLGTAHDEVHLAVLLQQGHNFAGATDVPIPGTLYAEQYFHKRRIAGNLAKKTLGKIIK